MNDDRFIKSVLYTLKRAYGIPANLVWRTGQTVDLETGVITVTHDSVKVDRAIVLPFSRDRDFAYDLTFIASNKNFTYGGLFDKNRRKVYVDKDDLPSDFEIKLGYYFVIQGKRFDVKVVDDYGNGLAYDLDVEQLTNIDLANQIEEVYYEDLFLNQTVEVTLNA